MSLSANITGNDRRFKIWVPLQSEDPHNSVHGGFAAGTDEYEISISDFFVWDWMTIILATVIGFLES